MNLNVKRKFHNGLFCNTSKNSTYSRSSKGLPDWNCLKIFHCQHIAGVEIQSMSLPLLTNIFNTLMHTLVCVNMTQLSRKGFFQNFNISSLCHSMETTWRLVRGSFKHLSYKTSLCICRKSAQSRRMAYWLEATYKPHAVLIKFIKNAASLSRFEGR